MTQRYDFSHIPENSIDEIYRNGAACLRGTMQLAIAADQRGTTMAGIFGAGSIALLATAATFKASTLNDPAFMTGAIVAAAFLFFAALVCAYSARPTDFYVDGYEPVRLAKSAGDLVWMKRYAAEDIQSRIDSNRRALERAASLLNKGAIAAAASPVLGIAGYFAT